MRIPTLNVPGDYPTRARAIRDIAFAFKELGAMPTLGRMSPGTWALLAQDHFAGLCPCANCLGAMRDIVLGGVTIRPDPRVPDGEHHLSVDNHLLYAVVAGYLAQAFDVS